jgi:hypothetical protein
LKKFDGREIETQLEKYFAILKEMTFLSFEEYKEICAQKNTPYSATTRAMMIRDHFKRKIMESDIFDGVNNIIKEDRNTFYMYLEGYPITFNKLDKNKRKRKYIDDIRYNIGYNFEQMTIPHLNKTLLVNSYYVTQNIPLTFGYILNSIGTEIVGLYLTYQIGKLVKWYKKIDFVVPLQMQNNDDNDKPKSLRVR